MNSAKEIVLSLELGFYEMLDGLKTYIQ
jgi:hypothetical protein